MSNVVNWFEIPVTDFGRARRFYEQVLGITIEPMAMGSSTMGMLSTGSDGVGGALVDGEGASPSRTGALVYLNGGADLGPMLVRAEQAGGVVVVPKTEIAGDFGYFAHFLDSEGNKIGIHSDA